MNQNILSIFQKHLGSQSQMQDKITTDIKSTNELIGSLQSLDSALKKCQNSPYCEEEIEQIVSNCFFMEKPLFGREIFIPATGEIFFVQDLTEMFQSHSQENLSSYIQNKREEIKEILEIIFEALDKQECSSPQHNKQILQAKNFSHF